jgi:hypothetical protein
LSGIPQGAEITRADEGGKVPPADFQFNAGCGYARPPPTARISQNLDRSLRQAVAFAEERNQGRATPEQLLLALTSDADAAPVMGRAVLILEVPRASEAKNCDLLIEIGGRMDEVCESCHNVFWYPINTAVRN